jgi:hypothetical protein
MSYVQNPTDKSQNEKELAAFEGGIAVFEDAKTRVIVKQDGAAAKTAHGTAVGSLGKNAGVVMSASDVPGRFLSDTQGKA